MEIVMVPKKPWALEKESLKAFLFHAQGTLLKRP